MSAQSIYSAALHVKYRELWAVSNEMKKTLIELGIAAGDYSRLYLTDQGDNFLEISRRIEGI